MSKEANAATQEKLGEILTARDWDRMAEAWHEDVVDHDPAPGQAPGLAGIVDFWKEFTTAFPDVQLDADPVVVDDDFITAVFTIHGTHTGPFQGHEPTGRGFSIRGIQVSKFVDGRIAERWGATDEKGLVEQLELSGPGVHFVSK